MKIMALLAAALFGQDAQFAAFVERTNAAVPPPAVAAVTPVALTALRGLERQEGSCVPTGLVLEAPQTAIATYVISQAVASGEIKNGWTVYGRSQGCPGAPPVRFMVVRLPDDQLQVLVVNEGETLANPSLMRDTSSAASMAAVQTVRRADASCDGSDLRLGPTRIAERGPGLSQVYHGVFYAGSWREVWTFLLCRRTVEVPVTFTADGNSGAHFNVHATQARIVR